MRFHLAHRIEHHPDQDEDTGAPEERGHRERNSQGLVQQDGMVAITVRNTAPARVIRLMALCR